MIDIFTGLVAVFVKMGFELSVSNIIAGCIIGGSFVVSVLIEIYLIFGLCYLLVHLFPIKTYLIWTDKNKFFVYRGLYCKFIKKCLEKKHKVKIVFVERFNDTNLLYASISKLDIGDYLTNDYKVVYCDKEILKNEEFEEQ